MRYKGLYIGISTGFMLFLIISLLVLNGVLYHDINRSKGKDDLKVVGRVTSMSTLSPEQTIKREEIKQIIKTATIQALREIEARGGYLSEYEDAYYPNKSVDYALTFVPLYRACGEVHYPSWELIEKEIKARVEYLIDKKLKTLERTTPTFEYTSPPSVIINSLGDKIQVYATVYTKYKNKAIPESYDVVVPTRIRDIYYFATNFSTMMKRLRLIDYFVINTLYSAEDHYFPMIGSLTECGDSIALSPTELSKHFYKLYSYTLANTEFFKKPKFKEEDAPHYYIPGVNGKVYKGLSVQLRVPDDYIFVFPSGVKVTNNRWLSYLIVPVTDCIQRYDTRPSFYISYIVSARDDLLGQDAFYNFAEFSIIDKAVPASCSFKDYPNNTGLLILDEDIVDNSKLEEKIKSEKKGVCEKEGEKMRIKVLDEAGNPVEGAKATYGDCYLGTSNREGIIEGYGIYGKDKSLFVSKKGYVDYTSKLDDVRKEIKVRLVKRHAVDVDVDYVYVEGDLEEDEHDTSKRRVNINAGMAGERYLYVDRCVVENYPRDKGLWVSVSFSSNFLLDKVESGFGPEDMTQRGNYDYRTVEFPAIEYSYNSQFSSNAEEMNNLLDDMEVKGSNDPTNYNRGYVDIGVMPYYVLSRVRKEKQVIADYMDKMNATTSSLHVNIPIFYITNKENDLYLMGNKMSVVSGHYIDPSLWGALRYRGKSYKIYDREREILKRVCGIDSFEEVDFKYIYPVNPHADLIAKYQRYKDISMRCLGSDKLVDKNCNRDEDGDLIGCNFDAIKNAIKSQSNNKCVVY